MIRKLRSNFCHTENKDRCAGKLNKQCRCKFRFILAVDLMQTDTFLLLGKQKSFLIARSLTSRKENNYACLAEEGVVAMTC